MIQPTALRHPHITEELHRRVRPGKMGPIVRICIWVALLTCAISGLLEYWQTDWSLSFKPLGRGGLMVSLMTLLIVSGLLLYYGGEAVHDINRQLHIVLGVLFTGAILWHGLYRYIAGLRLPKTD